MALSLFKAGSCFSRGSGFYRSSSITPCISKAATTAIINVAANVPLASLLVIDAYVRLWRCLA